MEAIPPAGWILLAALLGFVAALGRFVLRWSRGRRAPFYGAGILDAPRRYLTHVHAKVVRRRGVGGFHIAAALGLIVLTLSVLAVLVGGWRGGAAAIVAGGSAAATLAGTGLFAARRAAAGVLVPHKASQLARLALFAIGFGGAATIAALELEVANAFEWALIACALAGGTVFPMLAAGPLRHAVAGYANLSVHTRPERFAADPPRTTPRPIDLGAPQLGVETRRDFAWNQLVQFDACVECRRCEEVCPARAAGTALNPMQVINAVRRADDDTSLMEGAVDPEAIWACTTCNACVNACPVFIEHVDGILDIRRFDTMERGATPGAARLFENLASHEQAEARPLDQRLHWAAYLQLRRLQPGDHAPLLFWVGDAGFLPEGRRILRAFVALLRAAKVEFAVLPEESDLGDIALRLGEEALFRSLATSNAARLDAVQFDRIVTIDPHVVQALSTDYLAIGRSWPVVHHSQLLDELLATGALAVPGGTATAVTFHDPCYLGRHGGEYAAPRRVAGAAGGPLIEMERSRRTSFCCGYGGGATVTDMPGERRIPDLRVEQARASGADTIAVGCPNCATMLAGSAGSSIAVRDIAELLLDAVEARA